MKKKNLAIILLFNTLVIVCSIFVIQACEKKENKNLLENTEWKLVAIFSSRSVFTVRRSECWHRSGVMWSTPNYEIGRAHV